MDRILQAIKPRAFWILSALLLIAIQSPATRILLIHPVFAWARRGSRSAASMKRLRGELADIMADVLLACVPHFVDTPHHGKVERAKLDFNVLNDAKLKVRKLAEAAGIDFKYEKSKYPHFYYIDDRSKSGVFELSGHRVRQVLDYAASADMSALKKGKSIATTIATPKGAVQCVLTCENASTYQLEVPPAKVGVVGTWLRDLSDGYMSFNLDGKKDFSAARMPGPFVVANGKVGAKRASPLQTKGEEKPWFIGINSTVKKEATSSPKGMTSFNWVEPAEGEPKFTRLHDAHKSSGAKMVPFAGWDMPVWYTSVVDEHLATRQAAGLFDVSHMGVYEVKGADAALVPRYDLRQRLRRLAARRKFIQPVPDTRCGCD